MKSIRNIYWLIVFLFFSFQVQNKEVKTFNISGHAQGTSWNITYFSNDSAITKTEIDSIFDKIDSSLSVYKPYSTISVFNNSSRGVVIDKHLKNIVETSFAITKATNGLSDITVGPLIEAWGFLAKESSAIPDDNEIKNILDCVGIQNIKLQNDSLIKEKPCVKIDVNGIAQGYTVDVIADYMQAKGITDFLVELGGELRVKGKKQPANTPFRIGIESPSADDFSTPPMQKIVTVNTGAITTSGNYRKYHESKGKKYSHIIDPRTGKSVENEMISVTVYAKDATTADAYDNALMLMGMERALRYIEERPGMAAFLIYNIDGKIMDTASSRFRGFIE